MSFLERWASGEFGQVEARKAAGYQRPSIEVYRQRFANAAIEAAHQLRSGKTDEKMGWCAKTSRGFTVTLRLGTKPLDCGGGRTLTSFPDAESAASFMNVAAQAALAGELDDEIQRAQVKRRNAAEPAQEIPG